MPNIKNITLAALWLLVLPLAAQATDAPADEQPCNAPTVPPTEISAENPEASGAAVVETEVATATETEILSADSGTETETETVTETENLPENNAAGSSNTDSETLLINNPPAAATDAVAYNAAAENPAPAAEQTTSETTNQSAIGPESTEDPHPPSFPAGAMLITELFPVPFSGGAEWVELWNAANLTIDLAGWYLTDAGGARTDLEGNLDAGAYKLVPNPKGKLNNTGDTITLFDPSGAQIDSVTYGDEIDRGESLARDGNEWIISKTPTPLGPNLISGLAPSPEATPTESAAKDGVTKESSNALFSTAEANPSEQISEPVEAQIVVSASPAAIHETDAALSAKSENPTKKSSPSKSETEKIRKLTLTEVRDLKTGSVVQTRGVVSVPPGIFGSRTFYVAGSGMQVYLHGIEVPALALGDVIELQGKIGSVGGEKRLVVSSDDWLRTIEQTQPPVPETIEVGSIGDETEGWLVTVEGTVAQKLDDRFIVEDASGAVPVVPKPETHIDQNAISIGDRVRVTGIISETKSGFRMLPRSVGDIEVVSAAQESESGGAPHISALTVLAGAFTSALLAVVVRKQLNPKRESQRINKPLVL